MADVEGAGAGDGYGAEASGDGVMKLRISKKAYVFEVRKKYAAMRNFTLKKKPETPAEDIKESLSWIFKKKPKSEDDARASAKKQAAADSAAIPKPVSPVAMAAVVVLALILFSVAFLALSLGTATPRAPAKPVAAYSGSLNYSIIESGILTASVSDEKGNPERVAYFLVGFSGAKLSGLNFTSALYSEKPPTQAFILEHARESAYSYPVFRSKLVKKLAAYGIPANDIDTESLRTLPAGSMLIIPTGYFPSELLEGSTPLYQELLSRGVAIIYIGYPFDKVALDKSGSTIPVSNHDFRFVSARLESKPGFELYDGQYTVEGASQVYGSVSVANVGPGTMIFLPQTLDSGWVSDGKAEGPEKAAADVALLASEQAWLSPFAESRSVAIPATDQNRTVLSMYSKPFPSDGGYVKFTSDAIDTNGAAQRYIEIFRINKEPLGDMSVRDSSAVPYFLSGQKTRVNLQLREPDSKPVKLYVAMYKDGVELQRSDLEFGLTNPTIEKSVDFQVDAPPGKYVMLTEDDSGKIYAATELDVVDLGIRLNSTQWVQGKFTFLLSAAGKPITPSRLTVTFDGKLPRDYSSASLPRTAGGSLLTYEYADKIDTGKHTFKFSSGGWSKSFPLTYRRSVNFWEKPEIILMALISLGICAFGYFMRRSEAPRYGLDIPDFPPLSTIKIPVKRENVLEIFDNVNLGYSWKWMPLRSEELKNGFRKLTYNGKPIIVGDFNLDRILSRLKDEGLVKNELDYWGLCRWEKESRHTISYLTLYRIMRNVFVNNAVKFSKIDAMPDCDMKAIAGKEELYFHIMEEPAERVAHRALATAKLGKTIVVFRTQDEADAFASSLTTTSKLAVALKMEIHNRNIFLMPVKGAISAYLKQIAT